MFVILYNPGAGGNMVASLIDNKDFIFLPITGTPPLLHIGATHKSLRFELQTCKYSDSELSKDELFSQLEKTYTAISDHDFSHYMDLTERSLHNPEYTYIVIDDRKYFEQTRQRVVDIDIRTNLYAKYHGDAMHNLQYFEHMKEWIRTVQSFKMIDKIILFEDILNGNLLNVLKQWVDTPLNESIYHQWLEVNQEYLTNIK